MMEKQISKCDFWRRCAEMYLIMNARKISVGYLANVYSDCHPSATQETTKRVKLAVDATKKMLARDGFELPNF